MDLKKLLKSLKLSEQTISTFLGALVIIVIGVLVFNYFRGVNKTASPEKPTPTVIPTEEIKMVEQGGKIVPEGLPTTYTVQKGDHLWKISLKYYGSGYNWIDIAKENKLKNPSVLLVDQKLKIPQVEVRQPKVAGAKITNNTISESTYTVVKGDNLWKIAVRAYGDGFKWTEIVKANKVVNPDVIHPGDVLSLPR